MQHRISMSIDGVGFLAQPPTPSPAEILTKCCGEVGKVWSLKKARTIISLSAPPQGGTPNTLIMQQVEAQESW